MTDRPLILEHDGRPAYVVVPYDLWRTLLEQLDDTEAVRTYDRAKAESDQEMVPIAVADALLAGENPVRVWRKHRGLTQKQLAEAAGIPRAEIGRIEAGRHRAPDEVAARMARALSVEVMDLL